MVDAFDSTNKVSTDNAAMVKLAFETDQSASDAGFCDMSAMLKKLSPETSRPHMSSFTAWSDEVFRRQGVESSALVSLSLPTDGDLVSLGEGWFMDWSMPLIHMNKVSTDLRNSTFTSRTHPLVLEVCERNVLRVASPVSPKT